MKRLLIVSNDRIGSRMAGPGIRYYNFARRLAGRFDVTLLVPGTADVDVEGVEVRERSERMRMRDLKALCARADVVLAQLLPPRLMRHLAASGPRAVYDLYDPLMMENLGLYAERALEGWEEDEWRAGALVQDLALATGDAFVCASERQRDLWLGALGALGRVDFARYRDDHGLRTLVDVVPFGLEDGEPEAGAPRLKGVVPGVGPDDRVVLWGGGIWNWLDPLTPIRGTARLARERADVRLYFMGIEHPNPAIPRMEMAGKAMALAEELGVLGRSVLFNVGWVPYAERESFLLEADLGVSAHLDTVEARYAFRTRVVDYLWAQLPVVATRGDALADLVDRDGLGRTVPAGDPEAWAEAVSSLLDDAEAHAGARSRMAAAREQFRWSRVVEPLARVLDDERGAAPSSARSAALLAEHVRLRGRIAVARHGVLGTAHYAARLVALRAGVVRNRWEE